MIMKDNLLKFPKPANQDKKCNSPGYLRVGIIIMILLMAVKILHLDDFRPEIYRQNDVVILEHPVKIPDDYMLADLSGNLAPLAGLLGSDVTILAFWATWCGYCAREFPQIDLVAPELASHNIKILPIARGDDTPEKIQQFFARGNIKNVESLIASTTAIYKKLGVAGYPTFIAVDKNGKAFAKLRPQWDSPDIFLLFEKLQQEK